MTKLYKQDPKFKEYTMRPGPAVRPNILDTDMCQQPPQSDNQPARLEKRKHFTYHVAITPLVKKWFSDLIAGCSLSPSWGISR